MEINGQDHDDAVVALAALAQTLRLKIFRALVVAGPRGMTPGAMSEGAGVPPATLSFHLKELMHAGLVSQQREGRFLIYRADVARMNALLSFLTHNCCEGAGCGEAVAPVRAAPIALPSRAARATP